MDVLVILAALGILILAAYRGYSVILFAPLAAILALLMTYPAHVMPLYSELFMGKMVGFIKLYFPVFLLGALFGKVIELSGFSKSIIQAVIRLVGVRHAMLTIVLVCALLTYGGVSLFVVAFAVYPFAAEMFKQLDIPKRLIPGTIALGAFTFTMDALPGTPQIQNLIPTTFFNTTSWAAPRMGLLGAAFVLAFGLTYLEWRRRKAQSAGEGYGANHSNEPEAVETASLPHPALAVLPLVVVAALNKGLTDAMPKLYPAQIDLSAFGLPGESIALAKVSALWSVEIALVAAILLVLALSFRRVKAKLSLGINAAVGGAMLASLNTASEYGFGAIIAAMPGFKTLSAALGSAIGHPLVNEAVTTTTLAGVTGSASGGMSIALAAMGQTYLEQASAMGIPPEVLHRVASMASGGMDTLPHNGAVITLLAVTGLTHRQSYGDIFAMTLIKTAAVFVAIAAYVWFGLY
jgi:H+/gluconate symporter-like permease